MSGGIRPGNRTMGCGNEPRRYEGRIDARERSGRRSIKAWKHCCNCKHDCVLTPHSVYRTRSGDMESSLRLFNEMEIKTTRNSLLNGYSKKGGKLMEARHLFDEIPEPDVFSYNIMLACYMCKSDLQAAREFFNKMPVRDTASCRPQAILHKNLSDTFHLCSTFL